jgi:plastocyanin
MIQNSVAITVSVSGGLAAYPPTGTVTLTDGATIVGSAPVDALGNAHFTLTSPTLGQHKLLASYAGDIHNSPATAPAFTQSVILRPTTNAFTASSLSLSAGQEVTFISLIQGVGPNFPTGTVTFVSGSSVLGTAPLNANGLATLTFTPQQGSYSIVAEYPGDSLFAASNSTTASVIVGPTVEFTMTVTPPTVSMTSGAHTTLNIAITSAPTFSDTLAIGCAGLPAFATCTFNTNNIKVSGGSSATLTLVLDTGDPLGAGASASLNSHRAPQLLACFLPGGLLLALLFMPVKRFRKQFSALAMLLLLTSVGMLSGCANSLTMSNTPAGNYTIQVVGTGAASGATEAGTITLTVNAK